MQRQSCVGLESDDLHLQAGGNSNIFNKHPRCEG
jgi:hypothetical protein